MFDYLWLHNIWYVLESSAYPGFKIAIQGAIYSLRSFNFIHEFDVLLSPANAKMFSYDTPYDESKRILFLSGESSNSNATKPLFFLSVESAGPPLFSEGLGSTPTENHKTEGDLIFHIPTLGSRSPKLEVGIICQKLNWSTNFMMEVA